jgi:Lar family restriction alleviation protein
MTNEIDSLALLPCPFCGSTDLHQIYKDTGRKWGYISCFGCGAKSGAVKTWYDPEEEWRAGAAAQWNRRASTGFFATLTPEQQKAALEYRGPDWHGPADLAVVDYTALSDEAVAYLVGITEDGGIGPDDVERAGKMYPKREAVVDYTERAQELWQELLDKDDRTSPKEYPEMVLITFDEFRDFLSAVAFERDNQIQGMAAEIAAQKAFIDKFNEVYDHNSKIADKIVAHHTTTPAIYGLQPDHKFKEGASPLDVAADIASALSALSAAAFEHQTKIAALETERDEATRQHQQILKNYRDCIDRHEAELAEVAEYKIAASLALDRREAVIRDVKAERDAALAKLARLREPETQRAVAEAVAGEGGTWAMADAALAVIGKGLT